MVLLPAYGCGEEGDKDSQDADQADSNREFEASSTLLSIIFK